MTHDAHRRGRSVDVARCDGKTCHQQTTVTILHNKRHLAALVAAGIVILTIASQNCYLGTQTSSCIDGLYCPRGSQCAAKQRACIIDSCGDGVKDEEELCDDGNIIDGDGCSARCKSTEVCGNQIVDMHTGEVCDDGNTVDGDGCSSDCRSSELCGKGTTDTTIGEVCDDANTRSGDGCSADCLSDETCGNGITDVSAFPPEFCDDGNKRDGDACSADCLSTGVCGDGILNDYPPFDEQCDDGNQFNGDGCGSNCLFERCGNGVVDPGEICDDGNDDNSDTCSNDCLGGAGCGNGVPDPLEPCDDGNTSNSDDCIIRLIPVEVPGLPDAGAGDVILQARCFLATCGDGFVRSDLEECDGDGQGLGGETEQCNIDCTYSRCGDGVVNLSSGEQCDDEGETAACNSDCRISICGDSIVNTSAGEECDSGGEAASCDSDCTVPVCGDGRINILAGEECEPPTQCCVNCTVDPAQC